MALEYPNYLNILEVHRFKLNQSYKNLFDFSLIDDRFNVECFGMS